MESSETSNPTRYWAISQYGPQLIDPHSQLYTRISQNLYRADRYSVKSIGRIVIESDPVITTEARSVGIDRKVILKYKTPEHIAIDGLRTLFPFG